LGSAFHVGGLRFKTQKFGTISGQVNSSLLMASVMGVLFPSVLTITSEESIARELEYSRATSVILLLLYGLYLYFQLVTHRDAYEEIVAEPLLVEGHRKGSATNPILGNKTNVIGGSGGSGGGGGSSIGANHSSHVESLIEGGAVMQSIVRSKSSDNGPSSSSSPKSKRKGDVDGLITKGRAVPSSDEEEHGDTEDGEEEGNGGDDNDEDDEEEEEDTLGFNYSIVWLAIITVFIAVLSQALVDSIEKTAANVSGVFLSAIVLPVVGNAAEHASAVTFALKGKLDLTLGVAIGSSTQIALMVLPMLVIIGWMMNKEMSLNFMPFETCTLFLTVLMVTFTVKNGTSNWLLGAILFGAYIIISAGFLVHNEENLSSVTPN